MTMKYNPTNILRLVEMTSVKEAAELMDVHPATINKAIAHNETTWKQEAKALKQVDRLTAEQDAQAAAAAEPAQLLVAVPPWKVEAFQKVASAMGLKVMVL